MASSWGFSPLCKLLVFFSLLMFYNAHGLLEDNLLPDCNTRATSQQATVLTGREIRERIFISTLDGRVSALDPLENGRLLWSHPTGSQGLFSSSMSKLKVSNNGQVFRLVPSLDGNIYRFNGETLERLPLNAETLLKSTFDLEDDTVITGGTEKMVFGINVATGEVQYTSAIQGSRQTSGGLDSGDGILVVQRVTHTVRAVEPRSGDERWNFSVGEHHLTFRGAEARGYDPGCHKPRKKEYTPQRAETKDSMSVAGYAAKGLSYHFVAKEGFIGASQGMSFSWSHKFDSPIVQAWQLKDGQLEMIDLFELHQMLHSESPDACNQVTAPADMYFGVYEEEYYIQHSAALRAKILENSWEAHQQYQVVMPRIEFKPYLLSGPSRTPHVNIGKQTPAQLGGFVEETTTAVALKQDYLDYPYDAGFYLQSNSNLQSVMVENETECRNTDESLLLELDDDTLEEEPFIIITSLWYWWKEVLAISIATSVMVNLFITRFVLKRWKQKILAESSNSNELLSAQLSQSKSSSGKAADKPADSPSPDSAIVADLSSADVLPYKSRYLTDFHPIRRLGKGGFGVVFEARNIIDDCHYAVKRISLPNRDEARAKVMREVKALAKLDHPNIVRYFNAWEERPPPGWQEHLDQQWDSSGHLSVTAVSSMACPSFSSKPLRLPAFSNKVFQHNPSNPFKFSNNNNRSIKSGDNDESGSFSFENGDPPLFSKNSGDSSFEIVFQNSQNSESHSKVFLKDCEVPFRSYADSTAGILSLSTVGEDSGCADRSQSAQDNVFDLSEEFECAKEPRLNRPDKLELVPMEALPVQQELQTPTKLYLYIQMQLCLKETLKDWLTSHTERDRDEILDIFEQIISAVQYVHTCNLMHRDLKPSNIFFLTDGTVKVGDFGLVTALGEAEAHTPADPGISNQRTSVPDKGKPHSTRHTDQVGTQLYMSPEQIAGEAYSHKVDVYSLGLIFFELLVPFSTQMERMTVLTNLKRHVFPKDFKIKSPDECAFVKHLLSKNPQDRPSVQEMRQHPLLKPFQPEPRFRRSRTTSHRVSSSGSEGDGLTIAKESCELLNVVPPFQ